MQPSENLNSSILNACQEVAKGKEIIAICIYGSQACGYARPDSDYDILLILEGYIDGVRYFYRKVDVKQYAILAVDQKAIELDVERGVLGDFVAGRLLSPYIPIVNSMYLNKLEFTTKRRFAIEDLEDLIIEYDTLARGLVIKPEYFVLVRMEKRSKSYPPLKYSYINMLRGKLKDLNMIKMLSAYTKVFQDLADIGVVKIQEDEITLVDNYVDKILSKKVHNKVVNLMDFSKRAFSSYMTHGKAGKVRLDVVAKELASKIKRGITTTFYGQELDDPKNYLYLKTKQGLTNLNTKDSIARVIEGEKKVDLEPLSGALNEVHLLTIENEKFVVKKFINRYNIKWFVLNIVAYGTKIFHLSGKSRLSNEYVTSILLTENKIPVPEIVSIDLQTQVLVERYIEGKPFLEVIVEIINSNDLSVDQRRYCFEIGILLGRIHNLNITLGDCKPENFVIGDDGKIYVLDLEQSQRNGDKAWDVAEFLYFSGHFGIQVTNGLQQFITDFVRGYASIAESEILKEAAGVRYTKVFLTWTPIPIIHMISRILKESVHDRKSNLQGKKL